MARSIAAALLACLVLSACTAAPDDRAGGTAEQGRDRVTTPPATSSPSAQPTVPTTPDRSPTPPVDGVGEVPLVLVTHLTAPPVNIAPRRLRALLRDGIEGWAPFSPAPRRLVVPRDLPAPPGAQAVRGARQAIQQVRTSRTTLALVPADAVDPTVNVVRVGGVHPLRTPDAYPVQTAGRPASAVVTLAIGGDAMMDRRVGERMAATGDFAEPFRQIAPVLERADISMVNLESTLADLGPPTQGIESFVADPRTRRGLRLAGVDVVSLANNHSGDYGPVSLLRTRDLLRQAGFATFGAGANLRQADRPAVATVRGVSVAFVGFNAIGETPPAGRGTPGASSLAMPPRTGPLDAARLGDLLEQVAALSARVDVVVVVPHWGTQYTARPEPVQSRVGRALLRAGADIVVGGHPHWVQAIERLGNRLVVHSLGNLVFDMTFSVPTQQGVVAEIVVWDDRVVGVDFVPYVISPTWAPTPVSPRGQGAPILQQMWRASSQPFASLGR